MSSSYKIRRFAMIWQSVISKKNKKGRKGLDDLPAKQKLPGRRRNLSN